MDRALGLIKSDTDSFATQQLRRKRLRDMKRGGCAQIYRTPDSRKAQIRPAVDDDGCAGNHSSAVFWAETADQLWG